MSEFLDRLNTKIATIITEAANELCRDTAEFDYGESIVNRAMAQKRAIRDDALGRHNLLGAAPPLPPPPPPPPGTLHLESMTLSVCTSCGAAKSRRCPHPDCTWVGGRW